MSSNQASTDVDGRLRTVHPSMWTTDRNLGSDRPSDGRIRTLDQDYHFKVDEWTDLDDGPWLFSIDGRRLTAGRQTAHLTDGFRRQTIKNKKCGRRWTGGQMDESPSVEAWFKS